MRTEQWSVGEVDPKLTESCPAYGNNPFLLYVAFQYGLQRVKAKVPLPQFLLYYGRDNPHYKYLLVAEVPESRRT